MKKILSFVTLTAVALTLSAPSAQAEILGWTKTVQLGYSTMTEDGAPSGSIGGHAGMFAQLHSVIGIGAEAGYHRLGSTTVDLGGGNTGDATWSTWRFTGNVMARGITGPFRPYAIGGAGIYPVRFAVDSATLGSNSTTETKFGFNLGAGATFGAPASPVNFGVEARWHSVPSVLDDGSGGSGSTSALDMVTIEAGIFF